MNNDNQSQPRTGTALGITSLTTGIVSIIISLPFAPLGVIIGIVAVITGIIALATKSAKKRAIAGIVTGSIGTLIGTLIVLLLFMAVPSLQTNQQDTTRKNDISILSSNIAAYASDNRGKLPAESDLQSLYQDSGAAAIETLSTTGTPSATNAVYTAGQGCDDTTTSRAYSVKIQLESGEIYCIGS